MRDGDVHAAAVGVCHRAGTGGKRVHRVMLRWRHPPVTEAPGQIYEPGYDMLKQDVLGVNLGVDIICMCPP